VRVIHRSYGRPGTLYLCNFETVEPIDAKLCTIDYVAKFSELTKTFKLSSAVMSCPCTWVNVSSRSFFMGFQTDAQVERDPGE
jgi:hypothetical protein